MSAEYDDSQTDDEDTNPAILQTRQLIQSIVKDKKTVLTSKSRKHITEIEKQLTIIETREFKHQKDLLRLQILNEELNKKANEFKAIIENLTSKIPSSTDIAEALQAFVASRIQEQLQDVPPISGFPPSETQAEPIPCSMQSGTDHQSSPTSKTNEPVTNMTSITKTSPLEQHPTKRTLVVKPRKETPGWKVLQILKSAKISVPAGVIEKVSTTSSTVEITCSNSNHK